jgi:hypothetical protein
VHLSGSSTLESTDAAALSAQRLDSKVITNNAIQQEHMFHLLRDIGMAHFVATRLVEILGKIRDDAEADANAVERAALFTIVFFYPWSFEHFLFWLDSDLILDTEESTELIHFGVGREMIGSTFISTSVFLSRSD